MSTPLSNMIERAFDEARPLNAQLELTYKCNLLCSFCYNSRPEKGELELGQWLETLDKLKAAGTFNVTLTGGEPFVRGDFFAIAEGVRERGLVLKTYTNGVLLADPAKVQRYAELAPFDTEISLHGSDAATHDRLTGIRGSFDKLLVALGHLSAAGVKVTLKTPITRLNQDQLQAIETLGESFGYHVTFDTNIVPADDGDVGPLSMAPDKSFLVRFFVEQVRQGKRGLRPRPVEKMKQNCGVGRTAITIDPYGEIFPCVAWRRSVANILEVGDLGALWNGRGEENATLEYVRKVAEEVPMTTLASRPEGAFASFCPAAAEKETGDPYNFYEASRVSGLTKLQAYEESRSGDETAKE